MNKLEKTVLLLSSIFALSSTPKIVSAQKSVDMMPKAQVEMLINDLSNPTYQNQSLAELNDLLNTYMHSATGEVWETVKNSNGSCIDFKFDTYLVDLMQTGSNYGNFIAQTKFKRDYSTTWAGFAGASGFADEEELKWVISINNKIATPDIKVLKDNNGVIYDAIYTGSDKTRKDVVRHPASNGVGVENHILWEPGKDKLIPLYNALILCGYNFNEDSGNWQRPSDDAPNTPIPKQNRPISNPVTPVNTSIQNNNQYTIRTSYVKPKTRRERGPSFGPIIQADGTYLGAGFEIPMMKNRWYNSSISAIFVYSKYDRSKDYNIVTSNSFFDENTGITAISTKTETGTKNITADAIELGLQFNAEWWHAMIGALVPIERERNLGNIYRHTEFRDDAGKITDPRDMPVEEVNTDKQFVNRAYFQFGGGPTLGPVKLSLIFTPNIYKNYDMIGNMIRAQLEFDIGYCIKHKKRD